MIAKTFSLIDPKLEPIIVCDNTSYHFKIYWVHLPDYGCQLLFTEGLSNNVQDVREGFEPFKKIELYFCLPDFWNINEETWPIKWMEKVASLPRKNETWFGPGDTIPAGNPPINLSDKFEANHFMLTEPILLGPFFEKANWDLLAVRFLGIVLINQKELDYKIRNSATILTERLKHARHTEKVDLFRTSVCRKRFLGFI
ncbi:MAG: hypothetical protein ACI8ZM_002811 [Crocinitomix sp.]|jgi:hypothetical protein